MAINNYKTAPGTATPIASKLHRRSFLQLTGMLAVTAGVTSCKKNQVATSDPQTNDGTTINFKDDTGIFNYIYVLEQLEAAFYTQLNMAYPVAFTVAQISFLNDIRLHEITHREFYKKFLGAAGVGKLEFDFSSIDFTSATAVLAAAKLFEDTGVAAYNGVLTKAQQSYTVTILSQVSSVEARHAAWIRGQVTTNDFSDLNDLTALGAIASNGLDAALTPADVLTQVSKYIKTKLKVINL